MLLAPPATGQLVDPARLDAWPIERIIFLCIAAIVVGGALLTITRRNPIAAVMSLVASFFGLAASYALLYAHFLAALQVLVYAGAIMTLFVFVVMVLNREETEAIAWRGVILKALGAGCIAYSAWKLGEYLRLVQPVHPEAPPASFGTVEEVGNILFTDYLFAFEAVSVLLLIAVIAAVVVARTHKEPSAVSHQPKAGSEEEKHS
jgi:NADH-quinone oxidoreductase subunit J